MLAELNAFPFDANINYLNGWLMAHGLPAIANKRLASPRDWLFASRAYTQLATEWPDLMKRIDPRRQAALDAVVADLEAAMHNISTRNTLSGTVSNQLLFTDVIANYQGKLDTLNSSIAAGVEAGFLREVHSQRLQRSEPFDLYGGIDQPLAYQSPEIKVMTCGNPRGLSFPAPNNLATCHAILCRHQHTTGSPHLDL